MARTAAISYAAFQRRLAPEMERLLGELFRENRGSIRVKKEKTAVRNLDKIFTAALALGLEKGFHAMSLRDLSRASGLSMGALYSYFASKEELRGHIFRFGVRFASEVVQAEADRHERPAEQLAAAIRAHLYLSEALRPWFYFAYMEARHLPPRERREAMENERRTEAIFAAILRRGRRSGAFRIASVELAAAAVKALLQDWYLKRWKYREAEVSVEAYADFVVDFIARAIRK